MTPTTILETILKFAPRRPGAMTKAIATLVACDAGEFVTVSEFKDARSDLSGAIDDAYDAARWTTRNAALAANIAAGMEHDAARVAANATTDAFPLSTSLASLAARHKRLGNDDTAPAEIRATMAAAAALKDLIESAKPKAKAGRRPVEKTAPAKARVLDMGTCAFCRRLQSVRGGMVDHGYSESRYGFRAGSCGGTYTQPIETSPDGLGALLHALESAKDHAQKLIDTPPTEHIVNVRNGTRLTATVFTSGPEFDRAARKCLAEARGTVALTSERIPEVVAEIAAWAPGKLVTAAEATARGV
jgi:hypothetical protein